MVSFIENIATDDFLWNIISDNISGRTRTSRTGFVQIKCPICHDYKARCGIKKNGDGLGINCYNCGFKTRWKTGGLLGIKIKTFLSSLGVSEHDISLINYKAFSHRTLLKASPQADILMADFAIPTFQRSELPANSKSFDELALENNQNSDFLDVLQYVSSRGNDIFDSYKYYWTPEKGHYNLNRRVIIPFLHEGMIVGFSARSIDKEIKNRYYMNCPKDFLFNTSSLSDFTKKYVILTEGVFDAIALNCVGLLGARLNKEQTSWIKSYGKTVIVLPDKDKSGQELIDIALRNNWHVAFPNSDHSQSNWWEKDIKDAAEAVKKYGSIWTLLSIIETATNNKMEINMKRRFKA